MKSLTFSLWGTFLFVLGVSALPGQVAFNGFLSTGKQIIVSLTLPDGRTTWCAKGDSIGEYEVVDINLESESVTVTDAKGQRMMIRISGTNIQTTADQIAKKTEIIPAEKLNWNWIRSDANPMRREPKPLPVWVATDWANLDENLRNDYRNYYRTHGWELVRVELSPTGKLRQSIYPVKNPFDRTPSREEVRSRMIPATGNVKQVTK